MKTFVVNLFEDADGGTRIDVWAERRCVYAALIDDDTEILFPWMRDAILSEVQKREQHVRAS